MKRLTNQFIATNLTMPDPNSTNKPSEHLGRHFIVDVWGAKHLKDARVLQDALTRAAEVADAILLHIHLHEFSNGGITGVALLAESHISVHTWPEEGYAAFDIFMCGDSKPEQAVELLKQVFQPTSIKILELLRGNLEEKEP